MPLNIQVYAPSVDGTAFEELADALVSEATTATFLSGHFGKGVVPAAFPVSLRSITSGLDLSHYWAVVNLYLNTPCGSAVIGAVAAKVLDISVRWAKRQRVSDTKKVKIRLYGPDGKLLSDDDV
ncbi:MAG TPA: hypothetical protein VGK29_22920 [Paludibaculum sp.]|jgi:hypothetical protein